MDAANLCEGVAATVFLQHCHSDDMKVRTEATGEYKTAMDFLRKASRPFPALLSAVIIPPPSQAHFRALSDVYRLRSSNNSNKTSDYGKPSPKQIPFPREPKTSPFCGMPLITL